MWISISFECHISCHITPCTDFSVFRKRNGWPASPPSQRSLLEHLHLPPKLLQPLTLIVTNSLWAVILNHWRLNSHFPNLVSHRTLLFRGNQRLPWKQDGDVAKESITSQLMEKAVWGVCTAAPTLTKGLTVTPRSAAIIICYSSFQLGSSDH